MHGLEYICTRMSCESKRGYFYFKNVNKLEKLQTAYYPLENEGKKLV